MADRLKNKAVEDIKSILSGTCPPPTSEVVESANANSRSNAFAADEGVQARGNSRQHTPHDAHPTAQISRSPLPR